MKHMFGPGVLHGSLTQAGLSPAVISKGDELDSPEIALERLERDIAARLRPVCAEMNDDEFKQLVRDIAKVKLKYDPDPFPSDPSASASDESILPSSTTPEQDPPNERRR